MCFLNRALPLLGTDRNHSRERRSLSLLRRLYRLFFRPYVPRAVVAIAFMAVAALMTGALAQLMEPIIDDVFTQGRRAALWPVAGAVFGAFLLRGVATYAHTVIMNQIGQSLVADIQERAHGHLLSLDLAFFQEQSAGELTSRLINDVTAMRSAVAECLTAIFKSSLTLLVLIGVMLYQDWRLALIAFCIIPGAAWVVGRIGKRLRALSEETQDHLGRLSGALMESFQGVRQIKAYNAEASERRRIGDGIRDVYRLSLRAVRVGELSTPVNELLSGLALLALILYGGSQVIAGENTAGAFMAFITAFLMAYEPIKRLSKLNNILQRGLGAAQRLLDLLDTQPRVTEAPDAVALPPNAASIALEQVWFRYPDGTAALEDVSISVEPGQTLAVVGPSGAGKSTVLNLIPRFYDPAAGRVLVGGHDVRGVKLESLRARIALVSQDVTLFDDSIAGNISLGRPDAGRAAVDKAARDAACGFIDAMPDGLDTRVGPGGVKLSGGQRQRIAIARALLCDAPILLLDEATSALDTETELAVREALKRLRAGRTTLVIAHRLSTVISADSIVAMEAGRVVEAGSHDALLAQGGLYARLYGSQLHAAE